MKVFFGLSGGLGPVMRSLPLAEHFRQAGDEVCFSIYDSESQRVLEQRGYRHLSDDDPTLPDPQRVIPRHAVFYNMDHYFAMAGLLDEHFAHSWISHRIKLIQDYRPDLVIADFSPHTIVAARVLNIPHAAIVQSCYHPAGQRVSHWIDQPRNLPRVTPLINKVLERYDLPPINKMEELLSGQLNIVPSFPAFDPIADPSVCYVGPLYQSPEAERNASLPDEPYILVYPGRLHDLTSSLGLALVQSVIAGFARTPYRVLVAAGGASSPENDFECPANISFIPYFTEKQLAHCALFIHHGGHGSCLAAIMQGVPSLIIPTNTEREYNARKMSELGVGEYMLPHSFTPDHLSRLAAFMIEDEYRDKAQALRAELARQQYGGAKTAYALTSALMHSRKM